MSGAELVLAADQFLMTPITRTHDQVRAEASGGHARIVIAGYHWFTDWGRDTMICLEGLTLCTGRVAEARDILRTFAHHVRDGLIPNMFPEGGQEGLYHTADATLWFFHAIDRYQRYTRDDLLLRDCCRRCGASSTPIARARASASASTRPTACCGRAPRATSSPGWTPRSTAGWSRRAAARRSRSTRSGTTPCRLLAGWLRDGEPTPMRELADYAAQVRASFNARFWNAERGHLFDVVDGEAGDDPACRPNQIFAISLRHPVLDAAALGRGARRRCGASC